MRKLTGRHKFYLVLMLVCILCFACKTDPSQPFVQRWLRKDPCAAPCWEGITLGKTTLAEAIRTLSTSSYTTQVLTEGFATGSNKGYTGSVRWIWRDQLDPRRFVAGSYLINRITVSGDLATPVTEMGLNFPYGFSLQQVIDAYGFPSHVATSVGEAVGSVGVDPSTLPDRYRTLHLIYLNHGFRISHAIEPIDKSNKISPNMILNFVTAFWPNNNAGLADSGFDGTYAVPWYGFDSFEQYCVKQGIPINLC